jgi:Rieske Fe-S protein
MAKASISRRRFLGSVVKGVVAGLVARPLLSRAEGPAGVPTPDMRVMSFDDKDFAALKKVGKAVYLPIGKDEKPLIVWRQSETSVRAFSSECTHAKCKVRLPMKDEIKCPCHGAVYDKDGVPTQGPTSTRLKEYAVQLGDNGVTVLLNVVVG